MSAQRNERKPDYRIVVGTAAAFLIGMPAVVLVSLYGSYYAKHVSNIASGDSGWAQAIGFILAIFIGFLGVLYQIRQSKADAIEQRAERGKAAHLLAFDAFETVTERLEAILKPGRKYPSHRLRGERTNEMVAAMRELDTSTLPGSMIADFVRLRSRVFAINQRITEIYRSEEQQPSGTMQREKTERYRRLNSAVVVWRDARTHFDNIQSIAVGFGAIAQDPAAPEVITKYEYPKEAD